MIDSSGPDSEMQRFESSRLSQAVRSLWTMSGLQARPGPSCEFRTQTIGQLRRRRASTVASTSRESTPSHAGLLWEPQGLVQMRVVEDIPEPIYGLPISPRLIGNHLLDRSQRKRENCVAAAF